jgi:hypothetical protein
MPIAMALWRLEGDRVIPIASSSIDSERRLEEALERDISILGLDRLLVIGRQVPTRFGKFVDLLALGPQGDVYVIELKRDRTPRDVVAQALDYGSWVKDLDYEDLAGIFEAYLPRAGFDDAQLEAFGQLPEDINSSHHLVIVASELDPSTERIVGYLSDQALPINVVFFRYLKDGQNEYLARSWLADPEQVEARATKKKRPWNGRDFYVAFGEGGYRRWEDAVRFGFVSGGGKKWYSQSLFALQPEHRVFVHIPSKGYVGVGRVTESAQRATSFLVPTSSGEVSILEATGLEAPNMDHDPEGSDRCEYVVRVEWLVAHPRTDAFWEKGLFANQNTATKLRDSHTLQRLEQHFGLQDSSP